MKYLIKFENLNKVFAVTAGILFMAGFASCARALTYPQGGDSASAVYPYPTNALVNDSGTIYFIRGDSKIAFTNWAAFIGLGYLPQNIISGSLAGYAQSSYNISTANTEHPWGSWLLYRGTVYYSTQDGLVGVPSADVFTSNGGSWAFVVKANQYDIAALNASPNLPALTATDPRIISAPIYQFDTAIGNPPPDNSTTTNTTTNSTTNSMPPEPSQTQATSTPVISNSGGYNLPLSIPPAPAFYSETLFLYPSSTLSADNGAISVTANSITGSQALITVTNNSTSQTQAVTLNLNSSQIVFGFTLTLSAVQQVNDGTSNGQPTPITQASIKVTK